MWKKVTDKAFLEGERKKNNKRLEPLILVGASRKSSHETTEHLLTWPSYISKKKKMLDSQVSNARHAKPQVHTGTGNRSISLEGKM